jgi:multidrug efflux pump subunit AcrB
VIETPNIQGGGLIALFARHRTAGNLLMVLMMVSGLMALFRMTTQFFPDFGIDMISVSVVWPGASAEDVDDKIVGAVEPEVRFLDGVKRVRSSALEGAASIVIEFNPGTDMQAALADVETAVGQVTTLPEDSETPEIRRIVRYDTIAHLVLSGPFSKASLKAFAKRIRDDLLDRGIDKVDLFGTGDEEIWVEVQPETLLELDTTLGEVAARIRETSQDLPSGGTTGAVERQVRSLGLEREVSGLRDIEVRALPGGQTIYLGDVARVSEHDEEGSVAAVMNGAPAIDLHIQRAVNRDALTQAAVLQDYLAEVRPTLPPTLRLEEYDIQSDLIRDRINLLLKNGIGGLVLVLMVLFVFLNAPVAFWVAMGIPTSILATMVVMLATGQSVNMVSLFGLIMALGIVVDDAIVVGEHAEARSRAGYPPLQAALGGARRMLAPVFSSSLTTIAAFTPLLVVSDIIGDVIRAIPFVIIAVLVASLVECFLVLPSHMRGALARSGRRPWRIRVRFDAAFARFRDGPFRRAVRFAVEWRYATLAAALASFILAVGMVAGGHLAFVFFPSPESDKIYANVQFPAGTPRARTEAMLAELDRALYAAEDELTGGAGGLVHVSIARLGQAVGQQARSLASGDHVGGMIVELEPSDRRAVRTHEVIAAWRAAIRPLPGLETLSILASQAGPPGREIDVRLSGNNLQKLKAASQEVRAQLASYPGISDVEDDLPYGKLETILQVSPRGQALGLTTESVGRQVRNALEGAIATRFARGDEEVTVRVRYPRDTVHTASLDNLYLRGPRGAEILLDEAVTLTDQRGFARIKREDGRRQVAVTAEVDETVTSSADVLAGLEHDAGADIAQRYGVRMSFAGKAEEQARTLGDMRLGALFGLSAIYIILAWVFSSYTRPLVVMSIIPLGFVGAVVGHLLLGFDLTILSLVALIGLSGIAVNDSIILVSTIDEHLAKGEGRRESIVDGACERLRAVILTSATTIGGLLPLMFEHSLQAQFLIPMALTMVFGLLATTLLVLFVVPALIAIQADIGLAARRPVDPIGPPASRHEAASP